MSPISLKETLEEAKSIAREAGDFLRAHAGMQIMEFKGAFDPVTKLDRESEQMITSRLKKAFPDHGILAEEGTAVQSKAGYCWIIDPLDGTTNYAHGLSAYAVSMGLTQDGKPVLGVIYAPQFDELFHAVAGGGAFCNDKPLHVSKEANLERGFLATGEPYAVRKNLDAHLRFFKNMVNRSLAIRRFGSASLDLCHVACGKYDGYWEAELKPWDAAAGILLVEEAGGKISDYRGNPYVLAESKTLLATNGLLHTQMMEALAA